MGKRGKPKKSPKKTSKKTEKERVKSTGRPVIATAVISVAIILFDVLVFIFIYQNKINFEKENLFVEAEASQMRREQTERKIQDLPNIENQIEQLKAKLEPSMKSYYGNIMQENIIYFMKDLQDETGINIKSMGFSKPSDTINLNMIDDLQSQIEQKKNNEQGENPDTDTDENVDPDTEPNEVPSPDENEAKSNNIVPVADMGEDEAPPPQAEAVEELLEIDMDVSTMSLSLDVAGDYRQFLRFMNALYNSEKRISITSLNISPRNAEKIFLEENRRITEAEADQMHDNLSQLSKAELDALIRISEEQEEISANLQISFYSVPSVEEYTDVEEPYNWQMKTSVSDPFHIQNFLDKVYTKENIYEFGSGTEAIAVQNTDMSNVRIDREPGRDGETLSALKFNFSETDKNPMVMVDLSSNNLSVTDINKIGIEMYSDGSNKSKIYVVLLDAQNQERVVEIADEIYWRGYVSLEGKIDSAVSFPAKVTGIMISQPGTGKELESGSIKFKKVFTATKVQEETAEEGTETTPTP